jgi:putative transposase
MKADLIHLSPKHICVPTVVAYFCLHRVRNVPNIDHDVVEVVYEKEELDYDLKQDAIAAINVGRDNLAALTANQLRFVQFIIKGQIIKSINRYYNQQKAKLKSLLPTRKQTSKLLMLMVV